MQNIKTVVVKFKSYYVIQFLAKLNKTEKAENLEITKCKKNFARLNNRNFSLWSFNVQNRLSAVILEKIWENCEKS